MKLPRWPLLTRGALLLMVLGSAALAVLGLRTSPSGVEQGYTCPMHPDLRRSGAGDCPICGMPLVHIAPPTQASRAAGGSRPMLPPGALEPARQRVLAERRSVPAWVDDRRKVQALVPAEEAPHLVVGERAEFRASGDTVAVALKRLAEEVAPHDEATSRVTFEPVAGAVLVPGTVGWLALSDRPRAALIVPSSAVLLSEKGPAVLVSVRAGTALERRPVRLGQSPDGLAVVVSGVEENERVVV
ncbi:MAG TPA: heavy metal-binding domain-containing protein, partial [Myxococcaceae bacterium]